VEVKLKQSRSGYPKRRLEGTVLRGTCLLTAPDSRAAVLVRHLAEVEFRGAHDGQPQPIETETARTIVIPAAPAMSPRNITGSHTYSTYARGLDILVGTYNFLDLVPKGRDEEGLARTMEWVRHHDKYDEGYSVDPTAGWEHPKVAVGAAKGSCCSGHLWGRE
jgi:hypothetical protein